MLVSAFYLEAGLLFASAYTSLADLRTFKDSLVSASHLSLRTLGLQVYLLVLSSPWVLESQTEVPSL